MSSSGVVIENMISLISIFSSLTFVVLTTFDHSLNSCCCPEDVLSQIQELSPKEEVTCEDVRLYKSSCETLTNWSDLCFSFFELQNKCRPRCDEYFFVRMPPLYNKIDVFICFIYLVEYVLKLYIA
jgi:hypothetical protein